MSERRHAAGEVGLTEAGEHGRDHLFVGGHGARFGAAGNLVRAARRSEQAFADEVAKRLLARAALQIGALPRGQAYGEGYRLGRLIGPGKSGQRNPVRLPQCCRSSKPSTLK
jgi:hypothetical protein